MRNRAGGDRRESKHSAPPKDALSAGKSTKYILGGSPGSWSFFRTMGGFVQLPESATVSTGW